LGYEVVKIPVRDNLGELEDRLCSFSTKDTFIFNNCDGFNGNNLGAVKVIRLIERMGFKHTGASADSVELCTNKPRCKESLKRFGVPTPRYQVFEQVKGNFFWSFRLLLSHRLKMPAWASIGFCGLQSGRFIQQSSVYIQEYQQPAMVEQFIAGRELAVAMWGNEIVEILPIAEDDFSAIPDPLQHVLTYESKWKPESPYFKKHSFLYSGSLTPKEQQTVQKVAEASFEQ